MNKSRILSFCKIILFLSFVIACKDSKEVSKSELKILIRTDNDCTNILTLDKDGNGQLTRGIGNAYREDFIELESVDEKFDYSIKSNEDIMYINKLVDSISKENLFTGGFLYDGTRYELYIDDEKKIDSYGSQSVEVHSILKKIWKNLPKKIDYYCQ